MGPRATDGSDVLQAEDGIRDKLVTGVQTCALPISVDNGAQVINMSFGKYFSPDKKWVDEAVKYAESKGVLQISAAGNENFNADTMIHFPNNNLLDGTTTKNWITVGASSDMTIQQI